MIELFESLYVAGLDFGTSKLTLSILNWRNGECVFADSVAFTGSVTDPKTGRSFQKPGDWLKAAMELFRRVKTVRLQDIAALCVVATAPTLVPLDKNGHLVKNEAIMWCDTMLAGSSNRTGTNEALRKLGAIAQRDPELWKHTAIFTEAGNFLVYQFTGLLTSSKGILGPKYAW